MKEVPRKGKSPEQSKQWQITKMIDPETVCFYYSKDKVKSKKEAAIYKERRKGRDGWKSPPKHPTDKTSLDASAKLTRAKLNKRSGDADLSKDNSSLESPPEYQRSWYVEGHIRSGVISSILMQRYQRTIRQRTIRQRYSPYEGPLSVKGHVADKLYQERAPQLCLLVNPNWHPDSCVTDEVLTDFNQYHIDKIKAHIMRLHDILEGVLVWSEVSKVWRKPTCDPVLRCFDNTVISIYDFFCMLSLDGTVIKEEPHRLDTSILDRVADHTTTPAPAKAAIPRATPEETIVTQPDCKLITKAKKAAKQKASTGPEAVGGRVELVDDGTLDDDDQGDDTESAAEDIKSFTDIRNLSVMLSLLGVREGRLEQVLVHLMGITIALETQPQAAIDNENDSNDNVDHYYEARVGNSAGIQVEQTQSSIASFFQSDFQPLVQRFLKSGEFNQAFAGILSLTISVGGSQSSLQDIAQLEPDNVVPPRKISSATASLRANIHSRHSTPSSGTFGHTSTLEHLKKKKSIGTTAPPAV
ncbi:hypothetical protein Tco_0599728 [Tanacetum coccineum]